MKKIFTMIIIFLFINLIFIPFSSAETIVIEGRSMMHGNESHPDTLDPGDVIDVIEIDSRGDIITYVEGKSKDYKKFGDLGDVIVYKRNGGGGTPVIHRAVCWIEFNDATFNYNSTSGYWTGGAYDIPELNAYGLTGIYSITNYGYDETTVVIDFKIIIDNFANITNQRTGERIGFRSYPHSGFITKGDSKESTMIDQNALRISNSWEFIEPVKVEWIKGKAKLVEESGLELFFIYVIIAIIIIVVVMIVIIIFFKLKRKKLKI